MKWYQYHSDSKEKINKNEQISAWIFIFFSTDVFNFFFLFIFILADLHRPGYVYDHNMRCFWTGKRWTTHKHATQSICTLIHKHTHAHVLRQIYRSFFIYLFVVVVVDIVFQNFDYLTVVTTFFLRFLLWRYDTLINIILIFILFFFNR